MKLKNLSYKSKLILIITPFIGMTLILILITSLFISDFTLKVTSFGKEEIANQKYENLLFEARNIYTEGNALLYSGKDTVLKYEHNEDQAAEGFLTQIEVLSGKMSTLRGQLISVSRKDLSDKILLEFTKLTVDLKKWAESINQKKIPRLEANTSFKEIRKSLKGFLKDNMTFEDAKPSKTPELISFVEKNQVRFNSIRIILLIFLLIVSLISIFISLKMISLLNSIINELKLRFENLHSVSVSIGRESNELSISTQDQTASLQETASTMEEITSMTRKNFSLLDSSKKEILENSNLTNQGTVYVNEMIKAVDSVNAVTGQLPIDMEKNAEDMNKIIQVIQDISNKTQIINDIVFQTKLLSFNASVEAARAGENGKGFSVVAEEIGKLAALSGTASYEISTLLNESSQIVALAIENNKKQILKSVEQILKTSKAAFIKANGCDEILNQISSKAEILTQMIESIVHSSNEQMTGAEQVNTALGQLDLISNKNFSISTEVSRSGEELNTNANALEITIKSLDVFLKGKN